MTKVGICDARVVIITGAARGLGKEYALAFAAEGAHVILNDLGGTDDRRAVDAVVEQIRSSGGKAAANHDVITDFDGAGRLIGAALETFGVVHTIVNNAGVLRLFPFEEESLENWDRTIQVHLRGHFCVARRALDYWLAQHGAGRPLAARIINISSGAGLHGAAGQASYSTSKAGIAALTLVQAAELGRYGVTANAIAPTARTRMTEEFWPDQTAKPDNGFDAMHPGNVAPTLVWLGSERSSHVTGCVFEVGGGLIALAEGWDMGPMIDRQRRWEPAEIGPAVDLLLSRRRVPRAVWNT